MKQGLGDAVVEASLELEKMVAKKLRSPGATLGDRNVEKSLEDHMPPAGRRLFKWWNAKRNAILHHGRNENEETKRQEIRDNSDPAVLRKTGLLLATIVAGKKKEESEIIETCRCMLPENVFDEVFGKTLRTLESASDLPGGGNSSTNNLSSTKNDKKATKVLDLLESKFGEIHRGRTNHVPPNELKLNSKGGSDDPKQLVIKPPILIPDLAARLGLKPFNIMADLIKIGTFPAPNRPLEPEIAARICEIHGFTLERERADKERGKGSPTNLENGHLKSGGTGRFLGVLDT